MGRLSTEELEHVGWEIVQDMQTGHYRLAAERLGASTRSAAQATLLTAFVIERLTPSLRLELSDHLRRNFNG